MGDIRLIDPQGLLDQEIPLVLQVLDKVLELGIVLDPGRGQGRRELPDGTRRRQVRAGSPARTSRAASAARAGQAPSGAARGKCPRRRPGFSRWRLGVGREGGGQEFGDDGKVAGGATPGGEPRHVVVGKLVAGAAQAGADHPDGVARSDPTLLEAFGDGDQILAAIGGLEFGKSAERQAERIAAPLARARRPSATAGSTS